MEVLIAKRGGFGEECLYSAHIQPGMANLPVELMEILVSKRGNRPQPYPMKVLEVQEATGDRGGYRRTWGLMVQVLLNSQQYRLSLKGAGWIRDSVETPKTSTGSDHSIPSDDNSELGRD